MNKKLYIQLLEAEVERLRKEVHELASATGARITDTVYLQYNATPAASNSKPALDNKFYLSWSAGEHTLIQDDAE